MPMFALAERGNSPVRHRRVPRTGPRIPGALAALAAGLALTLAAGTAQAQSLTLTPSVVDEQSTVSVTAALTGGSANSDYRFQNSVSHSCAGLFNFTVQEGRTDGSGNLTVTLSGTTGSVTSDQTCNIGAQGPTSADANLTIRSVPAPAAPAAPTVSAVPLQPDRLSVSWTAPGAAIVTDYDVRYYRGSADPADEADWIEAGETGGHDHSGTLTQATITGLDPVATYRVQVRATTDGTGPWSASGSGRTEALVGAWGSSVEQLVSNTGENADGSHSLASFDVAQEFTTSGRHDLGYTVTDVDVHFSSAPAAGVEVRVAGTTLRNPAALTAGVLTFTAPPGNTLSASTTYSVVVEGAAGSVSTTNSNADTGLLDWSIANSSYTRPASVTGPQWTQKAGTVLLRINGREKVGDPPGKPGAPTLAAVTGSTNVTATLTAPTHTGSGITDYDLRYYQGSADPTDEADWVEEDETSGLPFVGTADASTSVTITGLKASTDYRVQVRAESHGAPGPWSDSASVTTNAPTGTNNAPTRAKLGTVSQGCIPDDKNISWGTFTQASSGTLQSWTGFTATGDCGAVTVRRYPMFLDADGDDLTLTVEAVIPGNVRLVNHTPFFNKISNTDRLFTRGVAAGAPTDVRFNVTAVDPDGASAEGFFFVKMPTISTTSNNNEVPRFDEMVGTRGFQRNVPIPRWVLPPANGGETISRNTSGQLPYFYAVSGLPPGLSFDPMTRTITGTPTKDGIYTVTYTADDADDKYSLKDSPDAADLADAARQSFVVQVGAPSIELVQIVSAPTYDGDGDGGFDTYIAGDEILVDVQFTEAVKVTGTPENASAKTRVILEVNGANKFANLLEDGGVLYGGRRLRFGYTVTAADSDTDGVYVKPKNNNNVVLLVPTGLHVTSVKSGAAVVTTFDGLPTTGAANAKVDGSKSSDDIGPRPVSAATDFAGDTLTVTFSRALNTQVDLSGVPLEAYFSVQGAGIVGSGRRGTYQHPNSVTVSGKTLVMELNTPAQPGDTVTLSYENIGGGAWPLKDRSSTPKRVAGFTDLAVRNNTGQLTGGGLVGNLGKDDHSSSADLTGVDVAQGFTTGGIGNGYALDAVVLDFASAPAGSTFSVHLATGVSSTSAGDTVATLTGPATVAAGELRFTAPANTVLSADTQYFVVVQSTTQSGNASLTASKAEDAGAAAGWSIADGASSRDDDATGGFPTVSTAAVLKMRIDGRANVSVTRRGAGNLVGNLGKDDHSSSADLTGVDVAQGFTTGGNAVGYVLDAVVLDFATVPAGSTFSVHLATGVSSTNAGTMVATLTGPATVAAGELRFTAPAGTTLSADTQYFVVVQSTTQSGNASLTASKAEDAGAAAGWSIADEARTRTLSSTEGFPTVSTAAVLKMRIDGAALISGTPPVAARASAVGTALELVFDQRLDQDSRPPGSAFTVRATDVDDSVRTIAGAGSAVVIDDATVTVTLTAAVKEGELLSVSYAKPAASPLRAAAGSPDVLSFEGFHVEGVHDSTPPKLVGVVYIDDPANNVDSKWTLYFDEALDTGSAPARADFEVRVGGHQGAQVQLSPDPPAVANNAVTFRLLGRTPSLWFKYTPGTNPIRDLAGNPAAKIDGTTYSKSTAGKPAQTNQAAFVDGTLLGIFMTSDLDPTSVPAASAFTLHDTDAAATQLSDRVESVQLESNNNNPYVRLRLAGPVHPCDGYTPFKVKYTKPTGAGDAKLRGLAGAETDTFGPWTVQNRRFSQCVTRSVSGGLSGRQVPVWEQKSVTLKFDRALDRTKTLDPADFTVEVPGASGSSAPSVRGASHTADGTGVTLALSRARNAGETATVGYTFPRSGQGLWDTAGNQFDSFSGVEVKGAEDTAALTASFLGLPDAHDGFSAFGFELHFSEEVKLSHRSLRNGSALQVANGRVTKAKRLAKGENRRWAITVQPDEPRWTGRGASPFGEVTVSLAAASDCAAAGAVCTHGGKKLSAAVSATVPGPDTATPLPVLAVADARGDEGETLAFRVTLSEAATGDVTVDYATSDYSAAAGEDYTAASGTLTFAAGETEKTVSVALLHDGASDDGETFTLTLSNASGATVGDGEATGTVVDVPPLTATFHGLPDEHDGKRLFAFEIRFSEEFRGLELAAFRADALQVTNGRIVDARRTVRGQNRSVTVRVRPSSFDEVRLTLPATTDCSAASAICTQDGRKLSGTVTATVRGPVTVSVADAEAREGTDAAVSFAVTLNRAATREVTVNYATRDGTATAGEDYTFTRGTLTFAVGDTEKTVEVPILDDALDEGAETFTLKLMNATGARIDDGEATGTIENSDPLQTMWLSRFGRTVADHVTGAVSDRLSNPMTGMQVTVGGQNLDLARMEDEAWLDRTMVSMARVLGVPEGQGPGDEGWPDTGSFLHESPTPDRTPVRSITGREILLGSSFHLAGDGEGGGSGMTAWGRVTTGGFDGEAPADGGTVRIDGEVTTGILGTDAKWGRVLAGVALSVSEGEGSFDQPGVDAGTIESTMTTGSPYARIDLNERISAWGMAGLGTGDMTIVQEANTTTNQPERITRSDLSLRMAAVGGRGALMTPGASGGMDLALRADAFLVQTESEAVSGEGNTKADASRMRLILEGSRAFRTDNGVLTPGLELGIRHDGGDAETGTGVELGGRIAYANPGTGLSLEANVRALVAHEDSNYEEWGASGALKLVPGARGRGISFSLAPTYGAPGSGVEQLWSARDAGGLAQGGNTFDPESRIEGEIGYGLPAFGDRYTGTPNIGFGLSDGGSREYRLGWRLARAGGSSSGSFALSLDATRSEPANNNDSGSGTAPKHAVVLRAGLRW